MAAEHGWSSVPNWVIRSERLQGAEKWVYISLLNRANAQGRCWPSLKTLVADAGVSKNTVLKTLRSLESKGLIERIARMKNERERDTNVYLIHAWDASQGGGAEIALPGSNESQGVVQMRANPGSNESQEVLPIEVLPNRSTTQERGDVIDVDDVPDGTSRPEPIPDPFILTAQMKSWGSKNTPGLNIAAETKSFVAYWRHGEGKGRRKKNWYMTWQNWMRKQHSQIPASERKPRNVRRFNDLDD